MTNEIPDGSIKAVWQTQKTEMETMTLEIIRDKLAGMQTKFRRSLFIGAATAATGLLAVGLEWHALPDPLTRLGFALMAAGWLVFLYLIYRRTTARFETEYTATSTGFLRELLSDALRMARGGWVLLTLPFAPGVIVLLTVLAGRHPGANWTQYLPIAVLFAVWLIVMPILQRRSARRIEREIAELDAL
ncbi:MAG TPA: hypothetical protein VGG48_06870 [Rhizomicrobium sp.]|jgi:hypothetical protein